MKHFNLLLACAILLSLSGLCLYIILFPPVGMQQFIGTALNIYNSFWGKVLIIAISFICLGCGLSLLAIFLGLESGSRPHIILEQEGGAVGVSLDAIEEFIKKKGQSVNGVRDLTVRAEMTDEGISLLTRVTLELQRNIPEFIQTFQGKLHHELLETLGMEKVKEVQVLIHKIHPKEGIDGPLLGPPASVLLKDSTDEEPLAKEDRPDSGGPSMEILETIEVEPVEVKENEDKP